MPRKTYIYSQAELTHRTTLPLTRELREFLKEISRRCKDERGSYMDGSQIVRAAIAALKALEDQVDWREIENEEELVRRLVKAFRR